MKAASVSPPQSAGKPGVREIYPQTEWSFLEIIQSEAATDSQKKKALEELYLRYEKPVRVVVQKRLRGLSAEDVVQGFFATVVMKRGLFSRADCANKRPFRLLVQQALEQFIIDEQRHLHTGKEQMLAASEKLASTGGEDDGLDVSDPAISPELAYDVTLMWQTLRAAAEQTKAAPEYQKFLPYLNSRELPGDSAPSSQNKILWSLFDILLIEDGHAEIARRLGISAGDSRISLLRLKKKFADNVRREVRGNLAPDLPENELAEQIKEEIRELLNTFTHARKHFFP